MKRIVILAVLLLTAIGAFSQTARVIQLDKPDAQEAKQKWEKLQAAQAEWDAFQERVKNDYTLVSPANKEAGNIISSGPNNLAVRKGFESGFEFSADFKFIVPKVYPAPQPQACGAFSNWNCGTNLLNVVPTNTQGVIVQ